MTSKIEPFSRVALTWKGRRLEGILTPTASGIRLKLDSGYNVGLESENVQDLEVLEPAPAKQPMQADDTGAIEQGSIMLIHTGGTIASSVDYATGAVYPSISSKDLLASYPDLEELGPIHAVQISNIVSEDIRFSHMNAIAQAIHDHRDDPSIAGFIVTHGTDTLHYSASAISFILGGLEKPVVFVGAQRSSDRPSSDARLNLRAAALAIRKKVPPAVYVCMHSSIAQERCSLMLGVSARKMHASRRDAFASINRREVASIDPRADTVTLDPHFSIPAQEPRFEPLDEQLRVGVLVSRPNLFAEEVKHYAKYDGLVVEGTGFGHLPASADVDAENGRILEAVAHVAKKIPVVMTKRTISGVTNLNIYTPGRKLRQAGVLGHGLDCTPETAYMKLCWALSHHKADVAALFERNVCGEYTEARDV